VGVVVLKARIPELAPALTGFLVAYRQGVKTFNEQPDLAIKGEAVLKGEQPGPAEERTPSRSSSWTSAC
jgi:hypothetical protein